MSAEITRQAPLSGPGPELVFKPLRLTDQSRRRSRRPRTRGARTGGNQHAVVASILAVLALVGCVVAILMLATEPTAARLEREVASLNHRLNAATGQLTALEATATTLISQRSRLDTGLRRIGTQLTGVRRTVHGLQSATTLTQEQATGVRVCAAQIQQELAGVTLKTRTVNGHVASAGLSEPALLSPACAALFSGS